MTDQEINIAIAEACGWTKIHAHPSDGQLWGQHPSCPDERNEYYDHRIPDYCNDLNAMREAEKVLTEKQIRSYAFTLAQVLDTTPTVDLDDQFLNIHAPAQKRAEAFLLAIGKWKEPKRATKKPTLLSRRRVAGKIYKTQFLRADTQININQPERTD